MQPAHTLRQRLQAECTERHQKQVKGFAFYDQAYFFLEKTDIDKSGWHVVPHALRLLRDEAGTNPRTE